MRRSEPATPAERAADTFAVGQRALLRVAVIVASVREERTADPVLHWLVDEAGTRDDLDIDVIDLRDHRDTLSDTPLIPGGATTFIAERLRQADAFLILTPEYNHSYPAALKHGIDLHFVEWAYKPVTFVSYGALSGGIRAVEHLRQVFPELRATTTRSAVALRMPWDRMRAGEFDADEGEIAGLHAAFDDLVWWGRTLADGRRSYAVPA